MTIVSVQSFGVTSPGGGPRILRALFSSAPEPIVNVCLAPQPPPHQQAFTECHLQTRPQFGRFERTRLRSWLDALAVLRGRSVARELTDLARSRNARCIHAVAHGLEFWPALLAARKLNLPYFLSAHDHVRYALQGNPLRALTLRRLGEAWRSAEHRFVITDALARDYGARYGERPFTIITDGIEEGLRPHEPGATSALRVYFAGAFHLAYEENLRALLAALERIRDRRPNLEARFTCRCGSLPHGALETTIPVNVLPFCEEGVVQTDIKEADLLYLPLPFGERHADLNRFSLSTKAITYLGSGRPILYHGPSDSALGVLLAENDAAIIVSSRNPLKIADAVDTGLRRAPVLAANGVRLALEQFRLEDQRTRFWSALEADLAA